MKRTVLGPFVGLLISCFVVPVMAQAPSASARPGKPPHAHPGGSAGHDHGRPMGGRMGPAGSAAPAGSGHQHGPADRPSLHKRMMERRATHKARRDEHIGKLRARFSDIHLKDEALRNELRRHARAVAFLTRAQLVAEEELTDPKKSKVLKRIEVLLAKEQARHERHVARFTSAGAVPSGSAPPFASGVVPPPARSAGPAASAAAKPQLPPAAAASAGGAK